MQKQSFFQIPNVKIVSTEAWVGKKMAAQHWYRPHSGQISTSTKRRQFYCELEFTEL